MGGKSKFHTLCPKPYTKEMESEDRAAIYAEMSRMNSCMSEHAKAFPAVSSQQIRTKKREEGILGTVFEMRGCNTVRDIAPFLGHMSRFTESKGWYMHHIWGDQSLCIWFQQGRRK